MKSKQQWIKALMLHEKGLLCLSDNRALQFLLPRTLCDELVVKGDDCPSWRVSLVVKFNICLHKKTRSTNLT